MLKINWNETNELLWLIYGAMPLGFILDTVIHATIVYWRSIR